MTLPLADLHLPDLARAIILAIGVLQPFVLGGLFRPRRQARHIVGRTLAFAVVTALLTYVGCGLHYVPLLLSCLLIFPLSIHLTLHAASRRNVHRRISARNVVLTLSCGAILYLGMLGLATITMPPKT